LIVVRDAKLLAVTNDEARERQLQSQLQVAPSVQCRMLCCSYC